MKPTVSVTVIMGVFNPPSPKRLLEAVSSIVRQTFRDWELILYDDGSQEKYIPLLRRAARLDKRIRLFRESRNQGLAHALNASIRLAAGEWIARMDDDDISLPDRLEKQVAFLRSHPQYQWVGSNAQLIDRTGVWGLQSMPVRPQARDFLSHSPYIHPSVLFRKKILLENGGYRESKDYRQCEDYELFMRLHQKGYRGYNLQEPLLQYWEDLASYRKRTYSRRMREMRLRYQGFERLGLSRAATLPYVLEPLAVGAVPAPLLRFLRKRTKGGEVRTP